MNRMKNNYPSGPGGQPIDLNALLALLGQQAQADEHIPKFHPEQKVYLKCGELAGMVIAVTAYPNRYTYLVRWSDGTTSECEDFELSDTKEWKG